MRSLSFRSLFLLLMVTPVVAATALLGWMSYRAAREVVVQDALRAVKIAANAREQSLTIRLVRQRERANGFMNITRVQCEPLPARERTRCFWDALADFSFTEMALSARLVLADGEVLQVGTPPEGQPLLARLPPEQWVRVEPKQGFDRVYELVIPSGNVLLGLRFGVGAINDLFLDRYGLGETGETFLADSHGLFITTPKYPGHSGVNHSIDARPMQRCLAGADGEILAPDYRGAEVIHAFRYIEEIGGGCIMAHIEQAEAFAPAYRLRGQVIQTSVVLVLVTVGLSFLFARRLSRPVHDLTHTARALQAEDFDVAVPVRGPSELRTFATTFARMARSLQSSTDERNRLLVRETEARQEAEAQKALLRLIIEQSGEGLIMADAHGVIRVFNAAAERHHGVRASEVAAPEWARTYELFSMDGRPLPPDETPLFRAVRGEVVSNERWRVHRPDGQWRTLEGTASPLRQPDGTPVGGVLIAHDVTQQQEAESERERLLRALEAERSRLEEAVRIREDLVAVVSHDLRNPISAISMSASVLLKREELSAGQARGLGRIYSSADRALRMIRDLLDSTQARVGGIPVAPKPLDFHELARNVVEEVQLAHPERHILFHTMGDARGAWDADRMAQVITNLVGNAVQHSPLDSPVRVESCGLEGEVQLRVHNEGSPIPVEDIPTLFEPFRRGRGAGGAPGSVGLGLFITRQVVEAHGGIIEARSQQGEGTLFTVRFSRARMPAPSAA